MTDLDRSSGVLLHPTSLPGPRGVGELGRTARSFVDQLAAADQRWWQMLPLNPPGWGGAPYAADSAFAGHPILVDFDRLEDHGWVSKAELRDLESACRDHPDDTYRAGAVEAARRDLLDRAFGRWRDRGRPISGEFDEFRDDNAYWLDDYALYAAIKEARGGEPWHDWPSELKHRESEALRRARDEHAEAVDRVAFRQWLFDRQWDDLRAYAADAGVQLIGDIPIFVAMDSADVWSRRSLFQVDAEGRPDVVAGVPPDYFSDTGQKWGNPLYDWSTHTDDDYEWWMRRLERLLSTVDLARIDHFRGFHAYWAIPADADTAQQGEWREGPGAEFFEAAEQRLGHLPFVAEDLGIIPDEVRELRDAFDLPGMKILQFAFDGDPDHPFLPHTYSENCVAYTGTHDNDTFLGWYRNAEPATRRRVRDYLDCDDDDLPWAAIDALQASDAALTIFPAQDVLALDSEARMNTPGTVEGNWNWRMTRDQLQDDGWSRLGASTRRSDRHRD